MASASSASSTRTPKADVRNLNNLGALIERADDLVSTIVRNRKARAGLGRTGRAVLREHERQLDAELAGLRVLASYAAASTPAQTSFMLALAIVDLGEARARANRHDDVDLMAVLDRLNRLLDGARFGLAVTDMPTDGLAHRLAPIEEGPRLRASRAMEQIAQAEAAND